MNDATVPQPGDLQQPGDVQEGRDLDRAGYEVAREPFWDAERARGGMGYEAMDAARPHGWHPIPLWGKDGYNLGQWPLVIVFWRIVQKPGDPQGKTRTFELAEYVEGDVTCWKLPSIEALENLTAQIAFTYWRFANAEWVQPFEAFEQLPDDYKQKPDVWGT